MKPTHSRNLTVAVFISVVGLFLRATKLSPTFAADGTDAQWDAAVRLSRDSGKPTLVVFTADFCPASATLKAEFHRSDVAAELAHYCVYTVDMTSGHPEVLDHASQFRVDDPPQLIRFDTDQEESGRTAPLPPEKLVQWLRAGE